MRTASAPRYTFNGGTMPYNITATPGITFTATVNDAAVSDMTSPIAIHCGDAISLTSSVPVTWAGLRKEPASCSLGSRQ